MSLSNIFGQKQGQQQGNAPYNPFAGTSGAAITGHGADFEAGSYVIELTDIESFTSQNPQTRGQVIRFEGKVIERLSDSGTAPGVTASHRIHLRHGDVAVADVKALFLCVLKTLAIRDGADPNLITSEAMQADAVNYDAAILQVVESGMYRGMRIGLTETPKKTKAASILKPSFEVVEG